MVHHVIAIDGFAGTGKSTLAKDMANALGFLYLDTGAMYRAVTLYIIKNQVNYQDQNQLAAALSQIRIKFSQTRDVFKPIVFLNGEPAEPAIRSMEVANLVSEVAAISEVRRFLVSQQREIGNAANIVIDGRDIGTVVFPQAECKLFITAPMHIRVNRRLGELISQGEDVDAEAVLANLKKRDLEETTRADSPLKPAPDAILLDTGNFGRQEQLEAALRILAVKCHIYPV